MRGRDDARREDPMASRTAQTEYRRHLRQKNAGRARKNALANHGTTPAFSIHTPEADANAPAEQVSPK
jgi:hypothetical protein